MQKQFILRRSNKNGRMKGNSVQNLLGIQDTEKVIHVGEGAEEPEALK